MLKLTRLALAALAVSLLILVPLASQAASESAQSREQAANSAAGKFVQELGNQAIAVIASKDLSQEDRSQKFREMLRNSFDLSTIGRYVIGRSWSAATPDQKQEYMKLFEALVIKTYSDRFALYTGENFQVTNVRPENEKDSTVTSIITHPDGSQPTEVDWRVHRKDGKMGVIDVVVEGISLSITQKQEYASIIQRDGGKLDGLLALMRQQLEEPTASGGNHPG